MTLEALLEKNTKGIQDLLHHELSELAIAHALACLPQPDIALKAIEAMLYKRVVNIVQGIFEELLSTIELEETLQYDLHKVRQTIQLFVNERVKETCKQVREKIKWWKEQEA